MEEIKLDHVELLLDRVIIQQIKVEDEERESGFTVPAAARQNSQNLPKYGIIAATGPGDPSKGPMKVKVGHMVSYLFYSGTPLTFKGKHFIIMREGDIQFIINKK